jgi:hypothetical protein
VGSIGRTPLVMEVHRFQRKLFLSLSPMQRPIRVSSIWRREAMERPSTWRGNCSRS